jgi:hypothetical protein
MRRKGWLPLLAAAALPFLGAGCGESPSVTVYRQGQYQGKPDTRPWDGEAFKGDRAAWEKAIKARNEGQNEYSRVIAN